MARFLSFLRWTKFTLLKWGRRPGFNPGVGKLLWRREWQYTPVFLPGEFHGQRTMAGYSPCAHKESDTTEWLSLSLSRFQKAIGTIANQEREGMQRRGRSGQEATVHPRGRVLVLLQRNTQQTCLTGKMCWIAREPSVLLATWLEPTHLTTLEELSYGNLKGHLEKPMVNNLERPNLRI